MGRTPKREEIMEDIEATLDQLKSDALSGEINNIEKDRLSIYASILCHKYAFSFFGNNQYPQICELVRTNLLRSHIESLQSHITDLDKKNTSLQKWVIALASAALLGTVTQIVITFKSSQIVEPQAENVVEIKKENKIPALAPTEKQLPSSNTDIENSQQ